MVASTQKLNKKLTLEELGYYSKAFSFIEECIEYHDRQALYPWERFPKQWASQIEDEENLDTHQLAIRKGLAMVGRGKKGDPKRWKLIHAIDERIIIAYYQFCIKASMS